MSKRRSSWKNAVAKFLKERVESQQGISLHELTSHLSQLPFDLRIKYERSAKSLEEFLRQFPKVFTIRSNENVYARIRRRRTASTVNDSLGSFMTFTSLYGTDEDEVTCLTDVTGKVYRIFSVYGFISVKYPINTTVYFDVKALESSKHKSLKSSGLKVGDYVILDAKLGPKECEARFRASRVTRAPFTSSPCPSLPSDNGGRRANTVTRIVSEYGVIETVKPRYGFIKFGRNQRERAFFHADTMDESFGPSVKNLQDVLKVGDKVRLNAKRIKKTSGRVKWEATTVYPCRSGDYNGAGDSEGQWDNEVFMSDEEDGIEDLLQAKLDEYERREADIGDAHSVYADRDATSVKADSSNSSVKGKRSARPTLSEWERRRKLFGERGFLYPVTGSAGKIKFGPGRGLSATAPVEVTYRDMRLIDNLLWEVADGQEVSFDATKAEDNKWIATLVWIGQRPAKPPVGDSEDKNFGSEKLQQRQEPEQSGDFNREETLQNVDPDSPPMQLSIAIYKGAKGMIVQTRECTGTCEIRELAATRTVEFRSDCFYKDSTMFMGNLNEVLCKGDTVFLDYMVGVMGTKEQTHCDLVWQGIKPRGVRRMSAEEFLHRLQTDTQDAKMSLCFEDLETETERAGEASRGTSHDPSNIELQVYTVPSKGSRASSSTSLADLANLRAATSTTEADSESSECESAPDVPFSDAGVDNEVLRRLAKLAAEEVMAQKKRRAALRDVAVQTVGEGPSSRPDSTHLVSGHVDASTQTLSTGKIKWKELFIH